MYIYIHTCKYMYVKKLLYGLRINFFFWGQKVFQKNRSQVYNSHQWHVPLTVLYRS